MLPSSPVPFLYKSLSPVHFSLKSNSESVATEAILRSAAQVMLQPCFFNNEAAARDWLLHY